MGRMALFGDDNIKSPIVQHITPVEVTDDSKKKSKKRKKGNHNTLPNNQ